MDLGLGGQMMQVAVQERTVDSKTVNQRQISIDASHVEMLELEIEDLNSELKHERAKLKDHQASCAKHLRDLEEAEGELLNCQEALGNLDRKLECATAESNERGEELVRVEEELMLCKERLEESEREKQVELASKATLNRSRLEELELVRRDLDERTCQLVECQGRYELLENECSDQKMVIMSQNSQLERAREGRENNYKEKIKHLKSKVKLLEEEIGTLRTESESKTKDMNALRSYQKKVEDRKYQKEREVRESEKQIEAKISMINTLSQQIDDLQGKSRKIPGMIAQISKLESAMRKIEVANSDLKTQNVCLAQDLKVQKSDFAQEKTRMIKRISELESATKEMRNEKVTMVNEKKAMGDSFSQMQSEKRRVETERQRLSDEVKSLQRQLSELEQVRARRPDVGIVFCVDISGSLGGNPQQLAKQAFRAIINRISSKAGRAHVGIVVHAVSVSVVRHMSELNSSVDTAIDSIPCGGSENYRDAFKEVISLLSGFKRQYPRVERHVVMISDGEDCGSSGDVSTLAAERVPCHNVVIEKSHGHYYGATPYSSETEKYATDTGGVSLKYSGGLELPELHAVLA